jgi:hypothetical protein
MVSRTAVIRSAKNVVPHDSVATVTVMGVEHENFELG